MPSFPPVQSVQRALALLAELNRQRVTSVGGMRSRKSSTNTFSGELRTEAGSLTTSVFGWMRSNRWVVVM